MGELELWGGPECTVNRVVDRFRDQLSESGHADRADDIDLFSELGLAAVRYPVLWERVSPDDPAVRDWRWSDARLAALRARGIRPIVGLVHHGSGPRYTHLLDDGFAAGLAAHAAAVAERYPWVEEWTPVNEPVTTARFAALYGHWYPHRRDEAAFWRVLVNQIDGVRLAMAAIRRVNPAARLIQTDDLGRTYATAAVRDQAAFDNVRRWMGWDLLCGRVVPGHPLWARLVKHGLGDRIEAIAAAPCPPDLIGINHYLTSDRFLDHRVQRYPRCAQGGNGARPYADTEAVRVLQPAPHGLETALADAWARYRIPLAITEVHNGCTREEQMRWFADAWATASSVRGRGIDVRAVTAWALFGSHGWNTLLTAPGVYEPGVYDVRGGRPRATALVPLMRALKAGQPLHPVVAGPGWWRRPIRLHHPAVPRPARLADQRPAEEPAAAPILVTGATGTLGQALAAACRHRAVAHILTDRRALDLADPQSIAAALDAHRPWAVINAAGWVRVDDGEGDEAAVHAANAAGAIRLAEACAARGIATVSLSSDLVFDGRAGRGYVEADAPRPLNAYGRSKAAAERGIAALPGTHLVARTAAFFQAHDRHNFAVAVVGALSAGERFRAAADWIVSPTHVPDLCNALLDLAIDGEAGLWHLSNGEALSWAQFAVRIAQRCGLDAALVEPVAGATLGLAARRPAMAALATTRGQILPPLDAALDRFAEAIARHRDHALAA